MNEIAKIQLFRIAATTPWAEVETTQHNIRITYYEGAKEDAEKTVLVLSKEEAAMGSAPSGKVSIAHCMSLMPMRLPA